jgi:type IV fimbrial biogenesis protein FimT
MGVSPFGGKFFAGALPKVDSIKPMEIQMQHDNPRSQQRGLSLVEMSATLAVAAILAGTAMPSLQDSNKKRALQGTAAQLATDLQFARSEAIARNEGVRVSFHSISGAACVVIHTGATTDCSCGTDGVTQCTGNAVLIKNSHFSAASGIAVSANVSSMRFDPTLGTVTPAGTVKVASASGSSVHHVVSILGRLRSCSPGGSAAGYKAC